MLGVKSPSGGLEAIKLDKRSDHGTERKAKQPIHQHGPRVRAVADGRRAAGQHEPPSTERGSRPHLLPQVHFRGVVSGEDGAVRS